MAEFGHEYLQFLAPKHRNLSNSWFQERIQHEKIRPESENEHAAGGTTSLDKLSKTTPVEIVEAIELALFNPRNNPNVVVLVQDHYTESLEMLDYVFGTNHFSLSSPYRHNTAREAQDKGVSIGSFSEISHVIRLLELHNAIYNICLRKFLLHLTSIS